TIQTDVYAMNRDNKLPDIGVVAQRYTLDMMGASQQLQLRTWTPQLNRFSVEVPFNWEADTWYTMKFEASTSADGRAVLKGKVWKRGEEEPADWTITGEDELGNVQGSPGLFGNAKDAEIFYDNLTVKSNE
ncbi:MAG: pyrrolo-quinoline quinone, partial [Planctomycetaceae bacterium]|nr:pyrrolo-quinoline quinone [Planctomycetaceae bacterium]